jgi:polycomb protein EED
MDTSIKVWNLCAPQLIDAITKSQSYYCHEEQTAFKTIVEQAPLYSTNLVHSDYVDCCLWYGNCIVTKSTKNRIVLWSPDSCRYKNAPLILREYLMADNDLWFVRFDISIILNLIACGNKYGVIYIFSMTSEMNDTADNTKTSSSSSAFENKCSERFSTEPIQPAMILQGMKCATIRQLRFSANSEYLIAVSDDGSVYSWRVLL